MTEHCANQRSREAKQNHGSERAIQRSEVCRCGGRREKWRVTDSVLNRGKITESAHGMTPDPGVRSWPKLQLGFQCTILTF
jgi:hypothetical protein